MFKQKEAKLAQKQKMYSFGNAQKEPFVSLCSFRVFLTTHYCIERHFEDRFLHSENLQKEMCYLLEQSPTYLS